jgi:hypothetical protein
MWPLHRLVITPDDLRADFDAATIARGVRYATERRVRDVCWERDGRTVTGACAGSRGQVYGVDVRFVDLDDLFIEWAGCDCPVGNFCKHAVALLLTAATGDPQPPEPNQWRSVLARVLDEMAVSPPDAGAPIGLEFSLTTAARYLPGGMVSLRPVTIGKRGTWIKSGLTWNRLLYDTQAREFNRHHFLAVRQLAATMWRSGSAFYGPALLIGGASPTLWPELVAVQDAGVAMVAGKSSGLRAVELIKNAQLRLDFTADDEGGAVMSAVLLVDGERTAPSGVSLIGRPKPHGMHQVTDGVLRLGAFDPVPGPAMLDLLADDKKVHIPAESVDEVALSVVPALAHAVPVEVEEGLFTPPAVTGPLPVLTITMTGTGARAYWSIRYDVNDKHHDFDPDSPPQRTGYRDATAEESAWQQIAPAMHAVATASASIATLRGATTLTG